MEHTITSREAGVPLQQLLNSDVGKVCPSRARICCGQIVYLGRGVKRVLIHVAAIDSAGGLGRKVAVWTGLGTKSVVVTGRVNVVAAAVVV